MNMPAPSARLSPSCKQMRIMLTVFILVATSLISPLLKAGSFSSFSHDLYVNNVGDIYLKARHQVVVVPLDVLIPLLIAPTNPSYLLVRDASQPNGYRALVAYDEANSPLDLSGYTLYSGLTVTVEGDLVIPSVGPIVTSFVVSGSRPSGLKAMYSPHPHGLRVYWTQVAGATTYQVARSTDGGQSWNESYYTGAEPDFVDQDIDNDNLVYSYRVRACDSTCGEWSASPSVHE